MARQIVEKFSKTVPNLEHLPGDYGAPLLGHSYQILSNPYPMIESHYMKYGAVSKFSMMFQQGVMAIGPEIIQEILQNTDHSFSTKSGYEGLLGKLFEGGLLLRDFEDHDYHRQMIETALKPAGLSSHVDGMSRLASESAAQWKLDNEFHVFDKLRDVVLNVILHMLVGEVPEKLRAEIKKSFLDMMVGTVALLHFDCPYLGLAFRQGMDGRRRLLSIFKKIINQKQGQECSGNDMLTVLSCGGNGQEKYFTSEEIAQHLIFLMTMAHDSTISSMTMAAYLLSVYPDEQSKAREQVLAVCSKRSVSDRGNPLCGDDLSELNYLDNIFKETLRLYPPAFSIMRRTVKDCQLGGYNIPAKTLIMAPTAVVHHMENWWTDALKFDPERFGDERAEHKQHDFIWMPFGGGAHRCIGMHLSGLLFKVIMYEFLKQYTFRLPDHYRTNIKYLPFPKLEDNLPLVLTQNNLR